MTSRCMNEAALNSQRPVLHDAIVLVVLSVIFVIPASLGALFLLQA